MMEYKEKKEKKFDDQRPYTVDPFRIGNISSRGSYIIEDIPKIPRHVLHCFFVCLFVCLLFGNMFLRGRITKDKPKILL